MARGWESKSIEEQQAEAASAKTVGSKPLSPHQQVLRRQIEGLQLARKNVLQQLASATNQHHRRMLAESLAELDRQLKELAHPELDTPLRI